MFLINYTRLFETKVKLTTLDLNFVAKKDIEIKPIVISYFHRETQRGVQPATYRLRKFKNPRGLHFSHSFDAGPRIAQTASRSAARSDAYSFEPSGSAAGLRRSVLGPPSSAVSMLLSALFFTEALRETQGRDVSGEVAHPVFVLI